MKRKTWQSLERSAVLKSDGYMRLSADLIPDVAPKNLSFRIQVFPVQKRIELSPSGNGAVGPGVKKKAVFTNPQAKSPRVSLKVAMKYLGIDLPKKEQQYPVSKKKDGTLVIKF